LPEEREEAPLRLAHQPEPPGPGLRHQEPDQDLGQLVTQFLDLARAGETSPAPELVQPMFAPVPLGQQEFAGLVRLLIGLEQTWLQKLPAMILVVSSVASDTAGGSQLGQIR
jgi:hypothetical protein